MGHKKKNKSMGFCETGKSPLTNPNKGGVKSETKSNPDGSYTITKSKGGKSNSTTYKKENPKSNVYVNENKQKRTFTKKKDPSLTDKNQNKGSLYDMDGTMEKMPTLGPKTLSTSYKREQDYDRTHTATKKATYDPKKKK